MNRDERTRAILWMIADLDPEMPVLRALGHLRAVEADLERRAAERANRDALKARYSGPTAGADMARDYAGNRVVRACAMSGSRKDLERLLRKETGADPLAVREAAETLGSLYGEGPSAPPW